jgi:hypothetical protein
MEAKESAETKSPLRALSRFVSAFRHGYSLRRRRAQREANVATETASQKQKFGHKTFSPGVYMLDSHSTVWNLPLTMNGHPSTFENVFCKLRDSKIKDKTNETYVTEKGEIRLDGKIGEWPLKAMMRKLSELLRQGMDPHHVEWFYYDNDWSDDGDEINTFFVVHGDKIVSESYRFHSEEPLILERRNKDANPIWHSHPAFDEAFERYWYRKFYTETMIGQLMVLRPDEPILYYYERPQARDQLRLVTQVMTYRLLWVATPALVAIAFPSLKTYMAIVSLVAVIELLRTLWATRKKGTGSSS